MARMKSWWVGGGACGIDKELVGGRRRWWVGGGACGMNEELVGLEEVLMGVYGITKGQEEVMGE